MDNIDFGVTFGRLSRLIPDYQEITVCEPRKSGNGRRVIYLGKMRDWFESWKYDDRLVNELESDSEAIIIELELK